MVQSNQNSPSPKPKPAAVYEADEQTGIVWERRGERKADRRMARLSFIYLSLTLAGLFIFLIDVWSGRDWILGRFGFSPNQLTSPTFHLLAYVSIGGAIGATLDGIRSDIFWHAERDAYGGSFIWRDLSLPLCGMGVGLMTYVAVRGGAGVFSGDFTIDGSGKAPAMVGFGLSTLAGFSYHQVFRWLDFQSNRVFSINQDVIVPDVKGQTLDQANKTLAKWQLKVGKTSEKIDPANSGKVILQAPDPGSQAKQGSTIDIEVGSNQVSLTVAPNG